MSIIENIVHIPNNKIDKKKWDEAIFNSLGSRIYATSIWLDNLCPSWNALVLNDYELVMPLPAKKKWMVNYLAQPPFTQQLGLFSTKEIERDLYVAFLEKANHLYKFGEIATNLLQGNIDKNYSISIRKNYVLDLFQDYPTIQSCYSNDLLKKNLQRSKKFNLQYYVSENVTEAITIFKSLYSNRTPHVTEENYQQLLSLAKIMVTKKQALVREVRLPSNNELLACGLFFKDEKRIYNIASSTLPDGRTLEANHFLFDELIKEFAGTNLLLDFEGSDLPGVERFYKKYGSKMEPYHFIKWNNLPAIIKLIKH